jgi:transforming growth factor-beta-induced protein
MEGSMFSKRILGMALVAGLAMAPTACGTPDQEPEAGMEAPHTSEMPPAGTPETAPPTMGAAEPGTIVDVAAEAGTFETLLAAAAAAGLVETLDGEGPYTLFAPTDEAFAALPEGTVEALMADPDALREILLYHVVSGEVTAEQVTALDEAETAQGESVTIMAHDGMVMVKDATVIATDIEASNGIIHVIDAVLLPNGG